MKMRKRYSIAEARHNLAAIVHELEDQPSIELTRRGEPVAVLLAYATYQQLQAQGDFWQAYTAFRKTFAHDVGTAEREVWHDLRDRSPGRDVTL
jgi:prevent-host-death family protein